MDPPRTPQHIRNLRDQVHLVIPNLETSTEEKDISIDVKVTESSSLTSSQFEEESPENDKTEEKILGFRKYLGIIYTIISVNLISLTASTFKRYSHVHPLNVGVWSSPCAIVLSILIILYARFSPNDKKKGLKRLQDGIWPIYKFKKNFALLLVRAFCTNLTTYLIIMAFKYVSPADVRTVVQASVITIYIFGWLCLGEKIGIVPILMAFVAVLGIGILMRPPILTGATEYDEGALIGMGLAVICMLLVSINIIIIRYLQKIHHGITNLVVFIWSLVQGLALGLALGVFEIPPMVELLSLNAAGLSLVTGLAFLVSALQLEEAGLIALVKTTEVVFVFFWQLVIVGTVPDFSSILGAILVLSGVVIVTMRKWVGSLPENHSSRKLLKWILY